MYTTFIQQSNLIKGNTEDMDENRNRRSVAEAKRKRARRRKLQMYRRLAILGIAVVLALVCIILLIKVIGGGCSDDSSTDTSTADIPANATVNSSHNSGKEDITEDATGEEVTTGEQATENPLRYGDELYNDGELVVCIDPGHGGNDTGCIGIDDSEEKDDTLKLAMVVVKELESRGIKVVTTRTTDVWVDLVERPKFANQQNADVFVSFHRNSLEDDTVTKGFEAWINNTDSDNAEELAGMIMTNLENVGISKNRGVKKGTQGDSDENYRVNASSAMPSVLLEMGFMSSPTDNKLYRDNMSAYAKAIADAIVQWSQDKPY